MYIIRSITIKTSFLLHKNLPGLILGGYIYRHIPPSLRPWRMLQQRVAGGRTSWLPSWKYDAESETVKSMRIYYYYYWSTTTSIYVYLLLLLIYQYYYHHYYYANKCIFTTTTVKLRPPACITDPAFIGDPASIKTLSTCHTRVINFSYIIQCAQL